MQYTEVSMYNQRLQNLSTNSVLVSNVAEIWSPWSGEVQDHRRSKMGRNGKMAPLIWNNFLNGPYTFYICCFRGDGHPTHACWLSTLLPSLYRHSSPCIVCIRPRTPHLHCHKWTDACISTCILYFPFEELHNPVLCIIFTRLPLLLLLLLLDYWTTTGPLLDHYHYWRWQSRRSPLFSLFYVFFSHLV